jgi:hypothetical protein
MKNGMRGWRRFHVNLAGGFCAWLEARPASSEEGARTAIQLVAGLSSAIIATPHIGCGKDVKGDRISQAGWKEIYKEIY